MKKKLMMMSLLAMACAAGMAQTDEQLFTSPFTTDNGDRPYRIPAIVQTTNDEILVIADKRYCGGDVGQISSDDARIDLVYRRWNGEEWEGEKTIVTGEDNFGYGDAAVVADRENPENILLMCAAGNIFFTSSQNEEGKRLQCYRFRSTDAGKNWDKGTEMTSMIYSLASGYRGAFFSSGRICQSSQIKVGSHYRLYAALCVYKKGGLFNLSNKTYSLVIYSDDFGDTWSLLDSQPAIGEGGNEAKCEELPNGSVLVSSRASGGRLFNVFNYSSAPTEANQADGSWSGEASGISNSDSGTNGEILIVPAYNTETKQVCNLMLQSFPAEAEGDGSRSHVSIYHKELEVKTTYATTDIANSWDSDTLQITKLGSAYSSMIWQADGNIGFVWEDNYQKYGTGAYDIKYRNIPIYTITKGAYTNIQPKTMSQVPASCTASWCNNASYSTLYLPYGVELPENVTAYTGTLEGNVLTIKALESNVVPAYTAVLLEDMEKRSTIDLTMVNTTKKVTENDLQGTLTAIEGIDKSKYYVLGHGSKHIGFYHPNSTTLKANAAYIYVEGGASALSIHREGDATDIEESEFSIQDSELIYDLMGRRVTEMQPGRMYIVNGRKVVR